MTKNYATMKQPPPKPDSGREIWPEVMSDVDGLAFYFGDDHPDYNLLIQDMEAREALGRARYGTVLCLRNGRDMAVDAYQEALDLCVYLKGAALEEQEKGFERGLCFQAYNKTLEAALLLRRVLSARG